MAAPRGRGPGVKGLVGVVGRLALLVGLGFGLGLVIGLVSEEPALVYGHLRGEGETVPLLQADRDAQALEAAAQAGDDGGHPIESARESVAADLAHDTSALQAERLALGDPNEAARALPEVAAANPKPRRDPMQPMPPTPPTPPMPPERVSASQPTQNQAALASASTAAGEAAKRWAIQVGAFSDEATARRLIKTLEAKKYPVAMVPSEGSNQRWRVRVQPVRGEDEARNMANRLKRDERLPTWLIPMDSGTR